MSQILSRPTADLAATLAVVYLVWIGSERCARIKAPGLDLAALAGVILSAGACFYAIWVR